MWYGILRYAYCDIPPTSTYLVLRQKIYKSRRLTEILKHNITFKTILDSVYLINLYNNTQKHISYRSDFIDRPSTLYVFCHTPGICYLYLSVILNTISFCLLKLIIRYKVHHKSRQLRFRCDYFGRNYRNFFQSHLYILFTQLLCTKKQKFGKVRKKKAKAYLEKVLFQNHPT